MFRGRYRHTIDPKGRLSVPARFRDELVKRTIRTLVLSEGDGCVWAFPIDTWHELEERLQQQPQLAPEMRRFLRMTVASAKDCPVDGAGRTLVPPELREFAGLDKDVMIVGQLRKFEIWDHDRWVEHHLRLRSGDGFDEATRRLAEFGL